MGLLGRFIGRLAVVPEKVGRAMYLRLAAIGTRIGVFEIVPSTYMFDLVLEPSDTERVDLDWSMASPREEDRRKKHLQPSPKLILTDRLRLRPVRAHDLDTLHALWSDPAVCEYLLNGARFSREQVAGELEAALVMSANHGVGYWLIELKDRVGVAGFCGFRRLPSGPDVEIVFSLRPQFWGRGLATEAGRAVLERLWEVTSFSRIYGRTHAHNQRSIGVMQKLGMQFDWSGAGTVCCVIERANRFPRKALVSIRVPSHPLSTAIR
jgi:RimJ/RimL family protein N-acetyltransferase